MISDYEGLHSQYTVGVQAAHGCSIYWNDRGRQMDADIGSQCIEEYSGDYSFARADECTIQPCVIDLPEVRALVDANSLGRDRDHLPNMPVNID